MFVVSLIAILGIIRGGRDFDGDKEPDSATILIHHKTISIKHFQEYAEVDPSDTLFQPCRKILPQELDTGRVTVGNRHLLLDNILLTQEKLLLEHVSMVRITGGLPAMRYVLPKMWRPASHVPSFLSSAHEQIKEILATGRTTPQDQEKEKDDTTAAAQGLNLCILSMRMEDDKIMHLVNPIPYNVNPDKPLVESREVFRVFAYIPPQTSIVRRADVGYSAYYIDIHKSGDGASRHVRELRSFETDYEDKHFDPRILLQQGYDLLTSEGSMSPAKLLRTF